MKIVYLLIVIFSIVPAFNAFSQCIHLSDSSITYFNGIIDSLESQYERTKGRSAESLPQSNGHYFWFETEQADGFIHALENNVPIDSLVSRFPDMVLTKNLLLVRHTLPFLINGKQRTSIHGLPQRWDESFELNLDTARIHKHGKIEIYWQKYKTYDGKTILCGFWVLEEFKTWKIPASFSDWAHYHDVVTVSEEKLFLAQSKNPARLSELIFLDTLVDYFIEKSKISKIEVYRNENGGIGAFNAKNFEFVRNSDSLYQSDSMFKTLLQRGVEFSFKENRDNDFLLAWVERYYRDEYVLLQMRNNQKLISHFPDMKPIFQKQKMADYALKTKHWPTFVKSMISVGQQSVADTCQNYVQGAPENYYIRNLAKLDLNIVKILLAMTLRNEDNFGYNIFGPDYSNIVQLVRLLDYQSQEEFEKAVVQLIKNENVDPLNKYYFYLAFCEHLAGNLRDIKSRHLALSNVEYLLDYLPIQIRENIENPHKALYDLLQNETSTLDNFRIVSHNIITGTTNYSDYDYWSAMIYEKNESLRIYYHLHMPFDSTVTPFSNFLDRKDMIRNKIGSNAFIMELLEADSTTQLNVYYTKDNALDPSSHRDLQNMPSDQFESIDFEDAIEFEIKSATNGRGDFILLKDNRLLLTSMTYNYSLGRYLYNDLLTIHEKGLSGGIYSYKIFNEQGEMQN